MINVPIIKFSVDWWNTLHQPASVMKLGGPAIHPAILWPLLAMGLAQLLLFVTLVLLRTETEIDRRRLEMLPKGAGVVNMGRGGLMDQPALCDLLDDPQIQPGISRRAQGLLTELHHAIRVADGARLFRPGAGRKHHVGHPGGFCQENVLHYQVLQTG